MCVSVCNCECNVSASIYGGEMEKETGHVRLNGGGQSKEIEAH